MRKLVATLLVAVLVLAACGGDDDGGTDAAAGSGEPPVQLSGAVNDEGTEEATGDQAEIEIELDDNYFGPTFVKASPGATVTVRLHNEGDGTHTFTSDTLGVDEELDGGTGSEVDLTLPESGASAFYCRFHQGGGMQGAFFFEEGDEVGGTGAGAGSGSDSDDGGLDY